MDIKIIILMLVVSLAVNGKDIKKRQVYTSSLSGSTGCATGSCPLTSATDLSRLSAFSQSSQIPGYPASSPLLTSSNIQSYSGTPLLSSSNIQSYSGSSFGGQSSFVNPFVTSNYFSQNPLYVNQPSACGGVIGGCQVIRQPSPPQVIMQPPQIQTRFAPYPVPQVIPRVEVIRETVPQPYFVKQVVPVPVYKQVVVEKPINQIVPQHVEVIRDKHYPVVVRKPYIVSQKIQVPVPYPVPSNHTGKIINQDTSKHESKHEKTDSVLKTDSTGSVNITISVNNTNINDLKESTDMRHAEQVSTNEKQKDSTTNNCCTVVGPHNCDRTSCRRTRYHRCGSVCRNSKIIYLRPKVQPIYVPRPIPIPTPGSRCYRLNSYPYLDCRGSCSSCGSSGGTCSSSCYSDHYADDYSDYEDHESYCSTHGGPMC